MRSWVALCRPPLRILMWAWEWDELAAGQAPTKPKSAGLRAVSPGALKHQIAHCKRLAADSKVGLGAGQAPTKPKSARLNTVSSGALGYQELEHTRCCLASWAPSLERACGAPLHILRDVSAVERVDAGVPGRRRHGCTPFPPQLPPGPPPLLPSAQLCTPPFPPLLRTPVSPCHFAAAHSLPALPPLQPPLLLMPSPGRLSSCPAPGGQL
jgi:hypothetical protein